jgi:hypothetical protein
MTNKKISELTLKTSLSADDKIPIYDSVAGDTKAVKYSAIVNLTDIVKLNSIQTLTNKTLTSPVINSPTGIVKGDVGLGNVDNTSDATKNSASATLANKTLTQPTITDFTNATHDHGDADDGGALANNSITTDMITDGDVTTDKIADDAVTDNKLDYPRFWQEIARTTLTVAGDTITVSSIPARTYLRFILKAFASGGTLDSTIIFNADTGANYCGRWDSGGVHASSVNVNSLPIESGTVASAGALFANIEFLNIASYPKVGTFNNVGVATVGAGTAPSNLVGSFEWVNTASQISSITWTNAGTGNFAIGSEIVVLGHD